MNAATETKGRAGQRAAQGAQRLPLSDVVVIDFTHVIAGPFAAMILADLGELTAHQSVHAILFNERKFFRRSPDFAYVVKAKKETYDAWAQVLGEGAGQGLFRPDLDIFLTISTIVRLLNTGADWYAHEDGSPLDALKNFSLDELTDFYLAFILRAVRTVERAGNPIPRGVAEKLVTLAQNLQPSAC